MRLRWSVARAAGTAVLVSALAIGPAPSALAEDDPLTGQGTGAARVVDAEHTGAYVEAVYQDLFGRTPDVAGTSYWTRALLGGTPRDAVANSITSSEEFRSYLIADAYDEFLGRRPDAGGLRFWLDQMAQGSTIARMESGFIASDEFWAQSGGTASGWVTDLYAAVLGRDASPAEVAYWAGRTSGAASRGQVALGFLLSNERLTSVVDGYYQWLLGRDLDPSGQRTWVAILQSGGHDESIIGGIVGSEEYWDLVTGVVDMASLAVVAPPGTIASGPDVRFTVLGLDGSGRVVADVTDLAALRLDGRAGACVGNVCDLTTSVGVHTVSAALGDLTGSVRVPVGPGPAARVVVTAARSQLVAGEPVELVTTGFDAYGNETGPLDPTYTVDVGGTCTGHACTVITMGQHWIQAELGGVRGRVQVEVSPGAPSVLNLNPPVATATAGVGVAFEVRAWDRFGNALGGDLLATTTFTIDGSPAGCTHGVCHAETVGTHIVRATNGAAVGTAPLTVTTP